MDKKSLYLAGLIILGFAAWIWQMQTNNRAEQHRAVTVFSRSNRSLSLFREWKESAPGQSVAINRKAFLFPQELTAFDAIMIASPRMHIQSKEAKNLADYVAEGGRLVLSAHDRRTYKNLSSVLDMLDIDRAIEDHKAFTNKQITAATLSDEHALFIPQRQYGFYSLIQFDCACELETSACEPRNLACFVHDKDVGKGQVVLLLGLPLPANSMVEHLANIDFTLALGRWAPHLLIDEYHHFFTDKTAQDLLARLDFTLPLGGMIVGLILFFLFGHSRFHERPFKPVRARAYHELNENIVRKYLQDPSLALEAVDQQRQFLQRLFPEQIEAVNDLHQYGRQTVSRNPKALPQVLRDFVHFHREQLRSRGRRENG